MPKPEAHNKAGNREVRNCLLDMERFCRTDHIAGDDGAPNGDSETEKRGRNGDKPLARQTHLSGIFSSPFVKSDDVVALILL